MLCQGMPTQQLCKASKIGFTVALWVANDCCGGQTRSEHKMQGQYEL